MRGTAHNTASDKDIQTIEGVRITRHNDALVYFRKYLRGEIWSDIKDHLPILLGFGFAANVLEIGVRSGVSTSAFITGVLTAARGQVYSIDIENCSEIFDEPDSWTFLQGNSTTIELPDDWPKKFDVVFIDGDHRYPFVLNDLVRFGVLADHILLHDWDHPQVKRAVYTFLGDKDGFHYNLKTYEGSFGLAYLFK